MALNIINFSNGIRPEEIQENFVYLQEQIARERISVGGTGIASGLEIKTIIDDENFQISISSGVIIDDEGNENFIESKVIDIAPPILQSYKETLTLTQERTVKLKHVPYALNRRHPAEYLSDYDLEYSGIEIKHINSVYLDDYIRVKNIVDNTLTIAGALQNDVDITYKYTAKRIDTLYLDTNLVIKIKQGTTSTTPSAILPSDAKYLIAYLEIDNEYISEEENIPKAHIYIKNDLRTIRNLYTTEDGVLYICGVPFDDLQIIHLNEPNEPKENCLWLNASDNTLYCWKSTDEFTYKNKIEITDENISEDIYDLVYSTYMDFELGGTELTVYLNEIPLKLNRDYEEVSNYLPTYAGNEGNNKGNGFRILQTLERADGLKDILIKNDVLTYTISYKDSQYMWVPLNKMNYVPVKNKKVYSTYYDGIEDKYIYEIDKQTKKAYFDSSLANSLGVDIKSNYPYKYQYFIFDRTKDLNMHFTPGQNQLSIMINQIFLHQDQFKEITVFDLLKHDGKRELNLPSEVITAAANSFGWTSDALNEFDNNNKFDRSGIGFMLMDPLDAGANADNIGSDYKSIYGSNDLFVEAIVEHRICSIPINRKLERSATFIHENCFTVPNDFNSIVEITDGIYLYDEHQLEVFVNGRKLNLGKDYIEQYGFLDYKENENIIIPPIEEKEQLLYKDQDYFIRKKAAACNMFKLLIDCNSSDVITYKITTNVYSYDHINNIFDNMAENISNYNSLAKTVSNSIANINNKFDSIDDDIATINEKIHQNENSQYLTVNSVLSESQMPERVIKNMIKSLDHINISITLSDKSSYNLGNYNIWSEDYINIFFHNEKENKDNFWAEGIHYNIHEYYNNNIKYCYLNIVTNFEIGDKIYITGLKISNS